MNVSSVRRMTKAQPSADAVLTLDDTTARDSIKCEGRTIAYVAIGYEAWGPLFAAAPQLLALAKEYASECGECAGVGIDPEDSDCQECKYVRDLIKRTET